MSNPVSATPTPRYATQADVDAGRTFCVVRLVVSDKELKATLETREARFEYSQIHGEPRLPYLTPLSTTRLGEFQLYTATGCECTGYMVDYSDNESEFLQAVRKQLHLLRQRNVERLRAQLQRFEDLGVQVIA